jgi:hypothetical protein
MKGLLIWSLSSLVGKGSVVVMVMPFKVFVPNSPALPNGYVDVVHVCSHSHVLGS